MGDELIKKFIRNVMELNQNVKLLTSVVYSSIKKSDSHNNDAGLPEGMTLPASTLDAVDDLQEQLHAISVREKLVSGRTELNLAYIIQQNIKIYLEGPESTSLKNDCQEGHTKLGPYQLNSDEILVHCAA